MLVTITRITSNSHGGRRQKGEREADECNEVHYDSQKQVSVEQKGGVGGCHSCRRRWPRRRNSLTTVHASRAPLPPPLPLSPTTLLGWLGIAGRLIGLMLDRVPFVFIFFLLPAAPAMSIFTHPLGPGAACSSVCAAPNASRTPLTLIIPHWHHIFSSHASFDNYFSL